MPRWRGYAGHRYEYKSAKASCRNRVQKAGRTGVAGYRRGRIRSIEHLQPDEQLRSGFPETGGCAITKAVKIRADWETLSPDYSPLIQIDAF